MKDAEARTAELEAALHLLEDRMATPEGAADMNLYEQHTRLSQQLEAAEAEWMNACEALEE